MESVLIEGCTEYELSVRYKDDDGNAYTKTMTTQEPDELIRLLLIAGMANQDDISVSPLYADQEIAQEDMEYDNGYDQTDVDYDDYTLDGMTRNSAKYFGRVNDHGNNPLFVESEKALAKRLKEEFRKYKESE